MKSSSKLYRTTLNDFRNPSSTNLSLNESTAFDRIGILRALYGESYLIQPEIFFIHSNYYSFYPIYPLEIGLYHHLFFEPVPNDFSVDISNDEICQKITVDRAIRDAIVHKLILLLRSKKKYTYKILIEKSFPVVSEWLTNISLPFSLMKSLLGYNNTKEAVELAKNLKHRIKVCINCFSKFSMFVPFDTLCSNNKEKGTPCKKLYRRDFINPLCTQVVNVRKKVFQLLTYSQERGLSIEEQTLTEIAKLYKEAQKIINKIASSFALKIIKNEKQITVKDFSPRNTPCDKLNFLPPNKDSKLYKKIMRFIEDGELPEEVLKENKLSNKDKLSNYAYSSFHHLQEPTSADDQML